MHEQKGNHERIAQYLSCILLDPSESDVTLIKAKLSCLKVWIKHGLPLKSVEPEINSALQLLTHEELFEPTIELLTEVSGLLNLDRVQSLSLIPIILSLAPYLNSDDEDIVMAIVSLFVTYTEAHCDDIFNALLEGNNAALEVSHYFLKLGTSTNRVFAMTINSWCMLHDLAIDAGLPPTPIVASLFEGLTRVLLQKAFLPDQDEWKTLPKDMKAEYEQFRRDLADCFLYCWRILNKSMYPILVEELSPSAPWRLIESRLFAFVAISDEVEEFDPVLGELLQNLPALATHKQNKSHAIKLFGCYAQHSTLSDDIIGLLMSEVKNNSETALEATRALYQITEDGPSTLLPRFPELVHLLGLPLALNVLKLVCRTVGLVISSAPVESQLSYLDASIEPLLRTSDISHLNGLIQAYRLPDGIISLEESQMLPKLIGFISSSFQSKLNIEHLHSIAQLLEAIVLTFRELSFDLCAPIIEDLGRLPVSLPILELKTTIICVFGSSRSDLVHFLTGSLEQLLNDASCDEDIHEGVLDLLAKAFPKCFAGLTSVNLEAIVNWTAMRLSSSTISTSLLRTIVKFHVCLLATANAPQEHVERVEAIYAAQGPILMQSVIFGAANHLTNSQLDAAGRLVFELVHRFPTPSRTWITHLLAIEGFPSPKHRPVDKESFKKAIFACRSVGKAKLVFIDFIKSL